MKLQTEVPGHLLLIGFNDSGSTDRGNFFYYVMNGALSYKAWGSKFFYFRIGPIFSLRSKFFPSKKTLFPKWCGVQELEAVKES